MIEVLEKLSSPTTAPLITTSNTSNFNEVTALMTYSYFPKIKRINDPDIPGRIMAQIANAPDKNRNPI